MKGSGSRRSERRHHRQRSRGVKRKHGPPSGLSKRQRGQYKTIALFGDLAKAVAMEAATAVAYWFGVNIGTVTRWRRALGVDYATPRTSRRHQETSSEVMTPAVLRRACKRSKSPAIPAKLAASMTGERHTAKTRQKISRAQKGHPVSVETQEKIRDAHLRSGLRGPLVYPHWTVAEEALLGKLTPRDVAERTERTLDAVYTHRRLLRLRLVVPGLGE